MRVKNNIPIYFIVITRLGLRVVASAMRIITPGSAAIGGLAGSLAPSHVRK